MKRTRTLVIGGGFYGMYVAEYLAKCGHRVVVCEREPEFMSRASYVNQARVHNGYHYPRSVLTALRSRVSFPQFCSEFESCIESSFDKYYLIGKVQSNVTTRQFSRFCDRIGARYKTDRGDLWKLVNPSLVDALFAVEEVAFNADKLREEMRRRLEVAGVECQLGVHVVSVVADQGRFCVETVNGHGETESVFDQVFNCGYSRLNSLVRSAGLPVIPLCHEVTEICMVNVPELIKGVGLTMMCGPYFSTMPFPAGGCHSFSHVRYTPHCRWTDSQKLEDDGNVLDRFPRVSAWNRMKFDAQRYIPLLSECEYRGSLWEIKTTLPVSDVDDSRPILFRANHGGLNGFHCVLGGKIDNVYDVISAIQRHGLDR